jgi:CRISPR/Cas system-associated exonuclease Cas4 (RecB family)
LRGELELEIKEKIEQMCWSYSRLNAYHTCPYMFYLQYIKEYQGIPSAFGLFGSFVHSILEKYFKGELLVFELSEYYKENFDKEVYVDFPPNAYVDLRQRYFETGLDFFNNFNGYENLKILEVEPEVNFKIAKYCMRGFIDLLARDQDNNLIIIDHKTRSEFKSRKELDEYLRQLYLYSIPIVEKYKEYPKELILNMIKEKRDIKVEYNTKKLEEAKMWVIHTIDTIKNDNEFKAKPSQFFCDYICSVIEYCPNSNKYLGIA